MKRVFYGVLLVAAMLLRPTFAGEADVTAQQRNLSAAGLALGGYDPVAYFTEKKAVKGKPGLSIVRDGAVYWFASKANREVFKARPHAYQPQYGGWCAFGMGMKPSSDGFSPGPYPVDPKTFKLKDGKLYLFFNQDGFNALAYWNRDEAALLKRADAFWQKWQGREAR